MNMPIYGMGPGPTNPMNNNMNINPMNNMNPINNMNPGSQQYLGQPQPYIQHNQTLGDMNPQSFRHESYNPQQQNINQGITMGFDQFFFNANDPNIAKTNVPQKMEASMHGKIIISTLILFGGVIAGIIIIITSNNNFSYGCAAIGVGFLTYMVMSITLSTIRGYITNLKKFDDYKLTYDKMVKGRGYFRFWIECYHYKSSKSKKGGSSRKKVVTHTAQENFYPTMSIDESGNVQGIKDIRKYIFINYLKRYYFSDKGSDVKLKSAYNSFVARNKKDQYQNHTNTFEIQGFEPQVGFCMQGESPHNKIIFYILTALGLALPYSCILERSISRYQINILKKLTY